VNSVVNRRRNGMSLRVSISPVRAKPGNTSQQVEDLKMNTAASTL